MVMHPVTVFTFPDRTFQGKEQEHVQANHYLHCSSPPPCSDLLSSARISVCPDMPDLGILENKSRALSMLTLLVSSPTTLGTVSC